MAWVCGILLTITFGHAILTEGWFYTFKLAGKTILGTLVLHITYDVINRSLYKSDSDRKD